MPQVFQVLRCYKCSIFQVHQTKKDNKWICKICGDKQSVKRHYGLGTAKDCRLHVQKLNIISGDRNGSILKLIDSDDSNTDDSSENFININQNNFQFDLIDKNNIIQQSKWSTYVENEESFEVTNSIHDNKESVIELPQKRKISKNSKSFKVRKESSKYNNNKNIDFISSNDEPNKLNESLTSTNLSNANTVHNTSTNQFELKIEQHIQPNIGNLGNSSELQTIINKGSKWEQFLESTDVLGTNDCNKFVENINPQPEHIEDNITNYNGRTCDKNQCEFSVNDGSHSSSQNRNSLFFQCDDKDLDDILDF